MAEPERSWRDKSRPRDTGGPLSPAQVSRGAEVVRSPVLGCAFARCAVSDNFCISCESSLSVCQRAKRKRGGTARMSFHKHAVHSDTCCRRSQWIRYCFTHLLLLKLKWYKWEKVLSIQTMKIYIFEWFGIRRQKTIMYSFQIQVNRHDHLLKSRSTVSTRTTREACSQLTDT